ncbi:hypothetical protein K2173_022905 [Erythroxylum novogranatense]|uniref:Uncharacterized protein n=1 Tax=Erythroxylum novogranatense TaxID=1862640 RepID=A0AAV8T7L1_9ROSI|nr:hypothetical protein K2173_022905 [Erythroxylum novogranatense]
MVTRRTRQPTPTRSESRRDRPPQGWSDGPRGSRFATLTHDEQSNTPTGNPPTVDSPRTHVSPFSSSTDQWSSHVTSFSSRRDVRQTRGSRKGTSGSNSMHKGTTSFPNLLRPTVGRPSSPNPVTSSPSQLLPSMGQTASTGPTSLSLPSSSIAGHALPTLRCMPPALTHSPSEPNSSHVAISLLSHVALVSPDPTSPLPIPVGLVNEAMDVAHIDPPGPMATSPLPHPIHEVPPPRPPDPCPIQQSAGAEPASHDTTMEEPVPPPMILPSHDPNGPVVPVPIDSR